MDVGQPGDLFSHVRVLFRGQSDVHEMAGEENQFRMVDVVSLARRSHKLNRLKWRLAPDSRTDLVSSEDHGLTLWVNMVTIGNSLADCISNRSTSSPIAP